jgi:hypothetical protein
MQKLMSQQRSIFFIATLGRRSILLHSGGGNARKEKKGNKADD